MAVVSGPDAAKLARQFRQMRDELDGSAQAARLKAVANDCARRDFREAVVNDLGDTSMSHWWRRKPIDVTAFAKSLGTTDAMVAPSGRALGPIRVLEDGRQGGRRGEISGFRSRMTKTKGRRIYATKFRANSGATKAKNTWSEAVVLFNRRAPSRLRQSQLAGYRKTWG